MVEAGEPAARSSPFSTMVIWGSPQVGRFATSRSVRGNTSAPRHCITPTLLCASVQAVAQARSGHAQCRCQRRHWKLSGFSSCARKVSILTATCQSPPAGSPRSSILRPGWRSSCRMRASISRTVLLPPLGRFGLAKSPAGQRVTLSSAVTAMPPPSSISLRQRYDTIGATPLRRAMVEMLSPSKRVASTIRSCSDAASCRRQPPSVTISISGISPSPRQFLSLLREANVSGRKGNQFRT